MSNKKPIQWHKQGLINRILSLEKEKEQLLNMQEKIKYSESQINISKAQIERAEKEGKLEFDNEKYNIKRCKE